MSEVQDTYEVAIVGYGPVGCVLAILLGQLGHRVVVLERWPSCYPQPRAVSFDHEVARVLQACGVGAGLGEITEQPGAYEWRNASGRTLLRFDLAGEGLSGWPKASMFCQPQLEALLDQRTRSLPSVAIRRGVEVTGVNDQDDGVTLTYQRVEVSRPTGGGVQATPTGEATQLRARYVVGCDGSNSTVRTAINAPVTDLGFFYDWLIVDVILNEDRVFDPTNLQICDPARPTTVVSGGPGRRRWEFMRLPSESIADLNDETTAWRLLEPFDVTPENARLERHAVYTFQARWVEQWRVGHVLLAGDAAHQMPPFAGQGMCAGLRDAANLAWKLDHVLNGHAPDPLLDSYGIERRPSVEAAIGLSMELGKVICVPDPTAAAARDQAMIEQASHGHDTEIPPLPGIAEGVRLDDDTLAGQLFLQARATLAGQTARLDDLVGTGWRLVTIDPKSVSTIDPDTASWFSDIGGRVVTLGTDGELDDSDGAYHDWFTRHNVTVVLQRPDFYIFGAGCVADDADRLLQAARRTLESCSWQ
jgi:2-polyprenyl-6-methoxyphenol hydroxylase-like FAD-dependent oxidoreductase